MSWAESIGQVVGGLIGGAAGGLVGAATGAVVDGAIGAAAGGTAGLAAAGVGAMPGAAAGAVGGAGYGAAVGGIAGAAAGGVAGWQTGGAAGRWIDQQIAQMTGADEEAEKRSEGDAAEKPCIECGDIDCFKPPKGSTPDEIEEMRRQLKEQADAINEIPPDELLENMRNYEELGRGAEDATSRATARDTWLTRKRGELIESGMSKNAAEQEAARQLSTMDVIHTPDLAAGGTGKFSSDNGGLGSRSINRSIGSQWSKPGENSKTTRLKQLKEHAEKAKSKGKKSKVKLKICDDEKS